MAAIPQATPQRDKVRFLVSRPVFIIPELVSFHSGATRRAISTRVPEPERFLQRPRTKMRLLAPGRFLAILAARATPANGAFALFNNTDHSFNTATGFQALFTNRTGQDNTATGVQALFFNDGDPSNNETSYNVAYGDYSLFSNTTGYANSAFGSGAMAPIPVAVLIRPTVFRR